MTDEYDFNCPQCGVRYCHYSPNSFAYNSFSKSMRCAQCDFLLITKNIERGPWELTSSSLIFNVPEDYQVSCPTCHAAVGNNCMRGNEEIDDEIHFSRNIAKQRFISNKVNILNNSSSEPEDAETRLV
jgi:hypothetical protein